MNSGKDPILYVDDDVNNLVVFKSAFMDHFDVVTCSDPQQAIAIMEKEGFPIVIADQRMPGMKGVEFFEIIKDKYPFTIRMILTAYSDVGDVLDAINRGNVYKYITKPWRSEEVLLTLHRAVEAYHLAISNQQLTEQLVQAAKFSALGQFAARITHEIRNQLGAITLAELIREKYPNDERLLHYADILLDARDHLVGLVSEVRDFSMNTPPEYEREPVALVDVAESALSLIRFDKLFDGKTISSDYLARPIVSCNKAKIKQVLINILQNAAYATEGRHPALINMRVLEDSDFGIVSVTDNGCGISPENRDKIWEPLFTTREDTGTGLGLDICRKIVEAHHGTIESENAPEGLSQTGAVFIVRLPLKK